jgi:hypothetical protein
MYELSYKNIDYETKQSICVKELSRLSKISRIKINHDCDSVSFILHTLLDIQFLNDLIEIMLLNTF